jgi:hypothetical protein
MHESVRANFMLNTGYSLEGPGSASHLLMLVAASDAAANAQKHFDGVISCLELLGGIDVLSEACS